jgi:hypothetical protein
MAVHCLREESGQNSSTAERGGLRVYGGRRMRVWEVRCEKDGELQARWSCGGIVGGRTRPEMPAPMMTTAALLYSLLLTGTCGQGLSPVIVLVSLE